MVDLEAIYVSEGALRLVPNDFAVRHRVLPIELMTDGRCRLR